jgi:hypothetical protein
MMLLPPPPGVCPICAHDHDPTWPHNKDSVYYQYRFYGTHGRWPTWADAIAHCDQPTRDHWERELRLMKAWSQPEGQPIADPPHDSIRQPVGDIHSLGFEPGGAL